MVRRQLCLWNFPDIGDPFDVAAFMASDQGRTGDANMYYLRALDRLDRSLDQVPTFEIQAMRRRGWTAPDPGVSAWVERNREALGLWKKGAECSKPGPDIIPPSASMRLHVLTLLAIVEAARLRTLGDLDGAWEFYRAILRNQQHTLHRPLIYSRMSGLSQLVFFRDLVNTWAKDPRVSTGTLRKALDEVVAAEALCPPNADTYKAEYIDQLGHVNDQEYMKRTLLTADGDRRQSGTGYYEAYWYRNLPWYEETRDFLNHEPERSRRVARLVYAHWIAIADGVRPFRTTFTDRYPDLFMNQPPNASSAWILPAGLSDWYHSSRFGELGRSSSIGTDWRKKERTILSQVIVALAEELYQREHGKPPESVKELVGPYLQKIPEGHPEAGAPAATP